MDRLWQDMAEEPVASPSLPPRAVPYVLGALTLAVGVLARLALDGVLGEHLTYLLFVPALLIAAASGGWMPTVATTGLALIASTLIFGRYAAIASNQIDTLLFGLLGFAMAAGGERLRRTQARAVDLAGRLLTRQAHLQSILDTVPDAMVVINEKGDIETFSPAAERLFGWTKAELVDGNANLLFPSPGREQLDLNLARYQSNPNSNLSGITRTVTAQRKDGSTFRAELSIGETKSEGRRFITGFFQDLSERDSALARVQSLQEELVQISRLSAMGEMASVLAHELNQPLSAISNYLKGGERLLRGEHPDSRAIFAMEKAAGQAIRAGEIIRRLREFVVRGESERSKESLRALTEEASGIGLMGAREAGVNARFEMEPSVDFVHVDRVQLQQVMLNLLRNAIEAMRDSSRRELLVSVAEAPDNMALVSVADTGSGVSPKIADRLFQPFVTTKGVNGMGVGLSISRTIIEAHGGRIWAEPNPGGGAIFRFTVPRVSA